MRIEFLRSLLPALSLSRWRQGSIPLPHRQAMRSLRLHCSHAVDSPLQPLVLARVPVREPRSSSMVSRSTGACIAVAGAFSTLRAGRNPQILGQCTMISDEQPTLVVTCKLSPGYRPVVVETISDRARIIFLDELEQAAARREALSSATVLLAHNTAKELRADETSLIGEVRLVQFLAAGLDFIPLDQLPPQVPVACNAGAQAESMAEHGLAMALAAAKHLPMEQAKMTRNEFNQSGATRMMAESTCGIFGLGGTGLALARLLKCVGARVHGINRRGELSVPVDWVGKPDSIGYDAGCVRYGLPDSTPDP